MASEMTNSTAVHRTILQLASADALSPITGPLLTRLGYRILTREGFDAARTDSPELSPDLLLVDERRLAEVARDEDEEAAFASLPIVLLSSRYGATGADSRIVGAVKRPAGLHDLYRLLQQIFEDTPRSTPRIATQLLARCESGGERWQGRVLSLSENGCLIRSPEAILLGQGIALELALPRAGSIVLEAEATYQLLPDTGLVFNAVPASAREALSRFVAETLLTA